MAKHADNNSSEAAEYVPAVEDDRLAERLASITEEEAEQRAAALRAGLSDYELAEEDAAVLEFDENGEEYEPYVAAPPALAVIGRPNVGKSTLVNRITRSKEAVVEDVPGVTRDRVTYDAEWNGKDFTLVDTGGWEQDARGMHKRVAEQAELAVDEADAVVFVVDGLVGATAVDEAVVRMLRRKKKPVLLVANKIDAPSQMSEVYSLWNLGLGEPYPVSALHGTGTGDLLDAAVKAMPETAQHGGMIPAGGPRRVALVGRPNVGKSSLLNKLAGSERVVVDSVAGTTMDPVDEFIELGGQTWRFVDTAGIRRRQHMASGSEYYAMLRTQRALDKAEVAVVLLSVEDPVSEQDVRIIQMAVDSGRALVIAYNKWDLMDEERRYYLEREVSRDLAHVEWAPRVNVSALTGWHKDKLAPALETSLASWGRRISTGRLNAFLGELVAATPHPVRGGKQPRILFATQPSTQPPRFVLFTTGFLDPGYRRFITRRLRETFDFTGSPIEVSMRVREKRKRK